MMRTFSGLFRAGDPPRAPGGSVSALGPCLLLATLAALGCPTRERDGQENEPRRARPPLELPKVRLERKAEEELLGLLEKLRSSAVETDYLGRVKAEEDLKRLLAEAERSGLESLYMPYVLQLLNEPIWDVRAATLRLVMRYGRTTPAAVAALVQVVGDMSMNAAVRDAAARTLEAWTRLGIGYNAWAEPEEVKAAAERWKDWLDRTGGVLPPR